MQHVSLWTGSTMSVTSSIGEAGIAPHVTLSGYYGPMSLVFGLSPATARAMAADLMAHADAIDPPAFPA